ncbi:murein biosynthesis integral membrane protein MurJ [Streptomyces sp. NPDC059740]|uniref:murein biosynthesis integral membrane protein MurJ n=1 Tax=Streptomyces sp. NPDC059740 TaxID=3346926 RepID=UPI00364C04EC
MAAGTVVSRASGVVRNVLQGAALGTGLLASTYNTANTAPTSLYTLMIGGALNSVLVPQLVRAREGDPDGGRAYEQRLVTLVLCVLGAGTVLAVWAAPALVSLYLPDTRQGHQAHELTVVFARFLLPQILFYGLYNIYGQVLNARNRFGAMMWTPILNNVVLVAMFGAYLGLMTVPDSVADITDTQVRLLGLGTTAGIAVQALALVPFARAAGFRFRPRFDWRHTGLGASIHAAKWTLLFVLANLVAMTAVTHWANAVDVALPDADAGYSAYSYAQVIWMLPQSVVTVSLVTALLPRMSRAVVEGRVADLRADLSRALRVSGAVIVPAAFAFVALGPTVATLLFAHGAGDAESVRPLGQMLQAFGLGLVPFSAQSLLLRGFYAFGDTRTPFLLAACIAVVNVVAALACHLWLPARWAVVGMAGAYALSYGAGLVLTVWRLRRRVGGRLDDGRGRGAQVRMGVAAAVAAPVGWAVARTCTAVAGTGTWGSLTALLAGAVALTVVYVALALLLGVAEVRGLPVVRRFAGARR